MTFEEFFRALGEERLAHNFNQLISTEADPRTPGGATILLAERSGRLYLRELPDPFYEPITWDELCARYPHAHLPQIR